MNLNPYISFPGQCEEALAVYEKVLGGKVAFKITYGEAPIETPTPENWKKKIMHARFEVNGQVIMACDASPDHYHKPQGMSVSINLKDPAEADRIYKGLSEKGAIHMPIAETLPCLSTASALPG
jgi:PhnB protein